MHALQEHANPNSKSNPNALGISRTVGPILMKLRTGMMTQVQGGFGDLFC